LLKSISYAFIFTLRMSVRKKRPNGNVTPCCRF